MQLQIEKYIDGEWWLAATLHIDQPAKGLASSCTLEYLPDYVLEHLDCGDEASLDFLHPLSFNHYRCDGLPAFFLDLLPSGNFNNDIGLPLTLLGLKPAHRYAVLEMGMNHHGELTYLSSLARPQVALVNNAMRAHIGYFADTTDVARAKAEIFSGLQADGVAIVNADDANIALFRAAAGSHRQCSFGLQQPADIRARDISLQRWIASSSCAARRVSKPSACRRRANTMYAMRWPPPPWRWRWTCRWRPLLPVWRCSAMPRAVCSRKPACMVAW
ncbi:Mur ligase family protein [Aquitalea magnusonii]|uniref:Mur ligase family protein n=1 Tax=Aquitalea magnusonii TaxID=332411 RepID=UPI000AFAD97E|nr:Mur ligase family protein [Aquitalea magnusonii]